MSELNEHLKTKSLVTDLETRMKVLEEELLQFSDEKDKIEKIKESFEKQLQDKDKEMSEMESKVKIQETEILEFHKTQSKLEQKIEDLKKETDATIENKEKIIKELKSRLKKISQMNNPATRARAAAGNMTALGDQRYGYEHKTNKTMS